MMTRDFTFRRAQEMRPQIQELVDGFLDDMVEKGPPADLVRDFALPVPSLVISLLLGVPYEDHEFFQHHSTVGLDSRSTDEEKMAAMGAIFNYVTELAERKEREPGDDLISRLMTDYVATGQLNRATVGDERCDPAAGRARDHREHDLAGNGCAAGAPRPTRPTAGTDDPSRDRECRRRIDAVPDDRAQPRSNVSPSKTSLSRAN